ARALGKERHLLHHPSGSMGELLLLADHGAFGIALAGYQGDCFARDTSRADKIARLRLGLPLLYGTGQIFAPKHLLALTGQQLDVVGPILPDPELVVGLTVRSQPTN